MHTLTASYAGDKHLTSATAKQDISVGYVIEVIRMPKVYVGGRYESFQARVLSADMEHKISGETVYLMRKGTSSDTELGSGTSGSLGGVTIHRSWIAEDPFELEYSELYFKSTINNVEYISPSVIVPSVYPYVDEISLTPSDNFLLKNRNTVLTYDCGCFTSILIYLYW